MTAFWQKTKERCSTFDWDDLFAYRSGKVVKIRDRRLGFLHLAFILASVFFIGYQTIYKEQGWATHDIAIGSVKLRLLKPEGPIVPKTHYCSQNCTTFSGEDGCNCLLWDSLDLVYPEEQEYSIFVATKASLTTNQTKQTGCDSFKNTCTSPWTEGSTKTYYLINVETFQLEIFHEAMAPSFYQQTSRGSGYRDSPWLKESYNLWGQLVDANGRAMYNSIQNQNDQIPVHQLFQAAERDFDAIREQGGILSVNIIYGDCSSLIYPGDRDSVERCKEYRKKVDSSMNYYQYRVGWVPESDYSVLRTIYSIHQEQRTIRNTTGVRMIFRVTGKQAQFSFPQLLISMVSGYVLLSFAAFIVDALVLYVLPGRKLYYNAKYEVTENFGDLRKNIMNERNLKRKIKKLTNMARFKETSEVLDTLKNLKGSNTDIEFDQLIMACIKVYGTELRDLSTANTFINHLLFLENKIKAHMMLEQMQEAFTLASEKGSVADVRMIKEECLRSNMGRVTQMCDDWLASHDVGMP